MRLLVLGATGPLGLRVVDEAWRRGHDIRALVRDPARMQGSDIQLVRGDAADATVVRNAVQGMDAVVSALGPGTSFKVRRTSTIVTDNMRVLLPAMQLETVRRFVGISALGVGPTWKDLPWTLRPAYRMLIRQPIADKEAAEALLERSDLDWTLVCPTVLTDREGEGSYRAGIHLRLRGIPTIARADVARLMLDCLESGAWMHERVEVTSPRHTV